MRYWAYHRQNGAQPGAAGAYGALDGIQCVRVCWFQVVALFLRVSLIRFRSYQPPAAFNARQSKIVAMIDKHSKAQTTAEFYASLFRPLADDQVAPPIRLTTREVFAAAAKAEQAARAEEAASPVSAASQAISPRPGTCRSCAQQRQRLAYVTQKQRSAAHIEHRGSRVATCGSAECASECARCGHVAAGSEAHRYAASAQRVSGATPTWLTDTHLLAIAGARPLEASQRVPQSRQAGTRARTHYCLCYGAHLHSGGHRSLISVGGSSLDTAAPVAKPKSVSSLSGPVNGSFFARISTQVAHVAFPEQPLPSGSPMAARKVRTTRANACHGSLLIMLAKQPFAPAVGGAPVAVSGSPVTVSGSPVLPGDRNSAGSVAASTPPPLAGSGVTGIQACAHGGAQYVAD